MRVLVITGLPGSGKTTLARHLARRYSTLLLSKDDIKEPLLEVLGAGDGAHSRLLSTASFAVLFALARRQLAGGAELILEGNFRPGEHEDALGSVPGLRILQVLCRIDEAARLARLAHRARHSTRAPGHRDADPAVQADRTSDTFLELPGERLTLDGEATDPSQIALIDRHWHRT